MYGKFLAKKYEMAKFLAILIFNCNIDCIVFAIHIFSSFKFFKLDN